MRVAGTILLFAVVTALTFAVHEAAHWATGEWLGYDMYLRTNSAGLAHGAYQSVLHEQMVTAAGPLVTMLQGLFAYLVIRSSGSRAAFAILLSALLMRTLAAGVSLATPNDEMRLSLSLGLDAWTLFGVSIGSLLVLTAAAVWRLKLSWREIAFGVACWFAFASAVILTEKYLPTYNPYAVS